MSENALSTFLLSGRQRKSSVRLMSQLWLSRPQPTFTATMNTLFGTSEQMQTIAVSANSGPAFVLSLPIKKKKAHCPLIILKKVLNKPKLRY